MIINDYVKQIKDMKIQGAEVIAKFALNALKETIKHSDAKTPGVFYNELLEARRKLAVARPTEPCMFNALKFVFMNINSDSVVELTRSIVERIDSALNHFDSAQEIIAHIASQKIRNGSVVFTHCHSSTIMEILREAKKQKKHFEVYNTETRPRFQGRATAAEVASIGIPVTLFIDSAARYALKKADVVLIGADAITSEGKVVNKIGSELFAEVANKFEIPFYACTDSWKFDVESIFGYEKNMEMRGQEEIWEKPPKGVRINNYAFEKVNPENITGIISEIGIYRADVFVQEVRSTYPWLFI